MLVVLGLVAGGCGDDDVEADAPPDSSVDGTTATTVPGDTPVSNDVDPTGPVEPGGAERVEPDPGAVNVHPVSFDPAEAQPVDENGPGVLVRFWGGIAPCFVLQRYDVEESAEEVVVTLYAGSDPAQPDAVCIEIALQYEVLVPLAAPLGDRVLVDGSPA